MKPAPSLSELIQTQNKSSLFCCAIYVRDARYSSMIHLTYWEVWISFKMLDRMSCSSNFKLDWNKRKKRDIILHWQIASLSKHQAQKDLIYWRILNLKVLFSAFQLSKINIFWKMCYFTLVRGIQSQNPPSDVKKGLLDSSRVCLNIWMIICHSFFSQKKHTHTHTA